VDHVKNPHSPTGENGQFAKGDLSSTQGQQAGPPKVLQEARYRNPDRFSEI